MELKIKERTSHLKYVNEELKHEIGNRKKMEEVLRASQKSLKEAQRIAHLGNWDWDIVSNKLSWSDEIYVIFGIKPQSFGASYEAFLRSVHPDEREFVKESVNKALFENTPYCIDHRIVLPDGTERVVHEQAEITFDKTGKAVYMAGTVQDITERKQAVESIVHMAYHDLLTGLPNRALLTDHLCLMLAAAQRRKILAAVLFIDLDRFKLINDTMGHSKGDEVLKAVAARLKKRTRESDTLARQGGDEFILLVQGLDRVEDITKVAENIFSALKEPFKYEGNIFSITVSMGVSIYPNDGEDADTLIKNADIAMYAAKDEGRNNFQLYNASMNESIAKRLRLENKLRKALDNDEFLLHYQPQVDSTSGEVIGIEALVRWQDPKEGLISPGEFIPIAEDTRLIIPIGEWVLRTACAQNKMWQDEGLKQMTMSVNISTHQFTQKDFITTVERILQETKLDPKYLELELTESIIMEGIETTIERLHALKAMGIRLSIDDFGTGYSSLEYLKRMPIDMLKIAQTFVRDITSDPNDVAIASATIQLAKSLQLEVIAEGVETREHLKLLNDLQCTRIQGYLFSKPLPSHEIEKCLKKEWRFAVE
jgi:diguanylate cyclase (GGDEF)-like protein/PAS domain S-box-containing protein